MTVGKFRGIRNTDTAAATMARVVRKRRRWAEELREAGWMVMEPPIKVCESCSNSLPSNS